MPQLDGAGRAIHRPESAPRETPSQAEDSLPQDVELRHPEIVSSIAQKMMVCADAAIQVSRYGLTKTSSAAPSSSHRCKAIGTLPFFQTKLWKARRSNLSPCFIRASASNFVI